MQISNKPLRKQCWTRMLSNDHSDDNSEPKGASSETTVTKMPLKKKKKKKREPHSISRDDFEMMHSTVDR